MNAVLDNGNRSAEASARRRDAGDARVPNSDDRAQRNRVHPPSGGLLNPVLVPALDPFPQMIQSPAQSPHR